MNPGWALDRGRAGKEAEIVQPKEGLSSGWESELGPRSEPGRMATICPQPLSGKINMVSPSSNVVVTCLDSKVGDEKAKTTLSTSTPLYLGHGLHSNFRHFLWAHQNLGVFPQKPWAAQGTKKGASDQAQGWPHSLQGTQRALRIFPFHL